MVGLPFFWSKILPISYSNYLSETEILNAMVEYLNKVSDQVNNINAFLSDGLPEYVQSTVDDRIQQKISDIQNQIDDIMDEIDTLNKSINRLTKTVDDYKSDLYAAIADLAQEIEDKINRQIALLGERIDALDNWLQAMFAALSSDITLMDVAHKRLISNYYQAMIWYVRKYFYNLSETTIEVKNPINGKTETLEIVLTSIVGMFALTPNMAQYESYHLSMADYERYGMSMQQYWLWGRPILERWRKKDDNTKSMDIFGNYRCNPVQSAYYLTDGICGMDNYGLTVSQYDSVSKRVGGYEIDRRGRYWLANIGAAVYRDVVHLKADTVTVPDGGVNHLNCLLSPDIDVTDGSLPTAELLNDNSVAKLIKDVSVECVDYAKGYVQYFFKNATLVSGGIALDIDVYNFATDNNSNPCTVFLDISGITTTY